jgi:hypothetical protein
MKEISINKKSRFDNLLNHKFKQKIILCRSDFDVRKIDATNINAFSLNRKISDFVGQAKVGEIERDIKYNKPELFLYPKPGKELDAVLKINEYKQTINSYDSPETAEINAILLMETMVDFNENRAAGTITGWIPGLVTAMRKVGMVEDGIQGFQDFGLGVLRLIPGGKKIIEKYKLDIHPVLEWPKNIRQFVSYDVKWGGEEANAWDEFKTAGIFRTAESLKMVTTPEAEKELKRLKSKFRSHSAGRLLATFRKYWWVIPMATIAVAAMQSMEEEKKKGGVQ